MTKVIVREYEVLVPSKTHHEENTKFKWRQDRKRRRCLGEQEVHERALKKVTQIIKLYKEHEKKKFIYVLSLEVSDVEKQRKNFMKVRVEYIQGPPKIL